MELNFKFDTLPKFSMTKTVDQTEITFMAFQYDVKSYEDTRIYEYTIKAITSNHVIIIIIESDNTDWETKNRLALCEYDEIIFNKSRNIIISYEHQNHQISDTQIEAYIKAGGYNGFTMSFSDKPLSGTNSGG